MNCIANASPTNDRVLSCGQPATVKVREQRSAAFAKVTGRDYTIHEVCPRHAQDLLSNARFTIAN